MELREFLLLPLDDLLVVTRAFVYPEVSRSCLEDLIPREESHRSPAKTFKDYAPGFVDVKYLPQMPGEHTRHYLFVTIDRASSGCTSKSCRTRPLPTPAASWSTKSRPLPSGSPRCSLTTARSSPTVSVPPASASPLGSMSSIRSVLPIPSSIA
ncbi:hypothetical protein [Plasticicumulans acidivorans]|uniref:hypothetical protein n=1 Tax=Plasticicumulans acidivorans TaxID=886464 RepID=UPI00319DE242